MTDTQTPVDPAKFDGGRSAVVQTSRGGGLRHVNLASGQVIQVQGAEEQDWFNETRDAYLKGAHYTENTDIQDLDRLLAHELMVYRWTLHLAAGVDYEGDLVDEKQLQQQLKLFSDQITKIKESMGLTRKARDVAASSESVADYLDNLRRRAKEFGIHRETQLDKALTLFNELSAILGAYDRADQDERNRMGFPDEDSVLNWVREVAVPEYRKLDDHFRANHQRVWIRSIS